MLALALALRLWDLEGAPPGLYYDEAANAIDALDLLADRRPRPFFPGNQGREPLHIYMVAAATALVGPGWLAVRLPAVLAGLLTVAATAWLAYEVGRWGRVAGRAAPTESLLPLGEGQDEGAAPAPRPSGRPHPGPSQALSGLGALTQALSGPGALLPEGEGTRQERSTANPAPLSQWGSALDVAPISPDWLAVLAGLLLAASYWHVALSRLGFRAVWVPLVVALALAGLLRAARTGSRPAAAAAGLAVGLGLYTYLAARVVPALVVAVALGGALALGWRAPAGRLAARRLLGAAALALAVAGLVAAPLGAYFWRHPDLFWARVESAAGGELGPAGRAASALGTLVWAGDPQPRHNLPERPAFDPLAGGLFLLGLALALRGWRDPARLALPLALAAMLLPQALATGEPHFLRASGALPPAVVLAALGLAAVLARLPGPAPRVALTLALAALWTLLAARDYFVEWAPSRPAYEAFEGQGRDAAALLPDGEPVAAGGPIYAGRGTFYLREAVEPFDAGRAVVIPAGGEAVVVPTSFDRRRPPRPWLGEPELIGGRWPAPDGSPAVAVYRLDRAALAPRRPLVATFGGLVALEGYDADPVVPPGARQLVSLTWRVLSPGQPGIAQFAHALVGEDGGERVLTGEDAEPFPSRGWRGGETVRSWFDLGLPPDAPAGAFWVETGFYQGADLRRLPVADAAGRPVGDRLLLGPFKIWDAGRARPRPAAPAAAWRGQGAAGGEALLQSVDLPPAARAGQSLPLRLVWWAGGPTAAPMTVFVHLLDADGRERAGADAPPLGGANPTSTWQPGETVVDERRIALPADLAPGRYRVECGLYDPATGQRMPLVEAGERLGDAAILGVVEIG